MDSNFTDPFCEECEAFVEMHEDGCGWHCPRSIWHGISRTIGSGPVRVTYLGRPTIIETDGVHFLVTYPEHE